MNIWIRSKEEKLLVKSANSELKVKRTILKVTNWKNYKMLNKNRKLQQPKQIEVRVTISLLQYKKLKLLKYLNGKEKVI